MPQVPIMLVEVFDFWGIDFMGSFLKSQDKEHIVAAVDYVSKWIKTKTTRGNDAKTDVEFLNTFLEGCYSLITSMLIS